jgi:hypothetical protein
MALDLANGYLRYDSASASNLYYGYNLNQNAGNGEYTWSIRRLNTSSNVQSVNWANGDQSAYLSSWTNRVSYFSAPTGSMAFTYSKSGSNVFLSWSLISGVDKYIVTATNSNNQILDTSGNPFVGPYAYQRAYTGFVNNLTNYSLSFINSGTYSVTLTGYNTYGTTASTYVVNVVV